MTGQFFVTLSDGLGKWRKGDVVAGATLSATGADIDRLMSHKAIRAATPAEADKAHVELPTAERHLSYEHQLAEKERDIARLTARVAQLEEQVAAGVHLSPPAMSHLNESNLIGEKDRAVKVLEARLAAVSQERDANHAELVKARAQAASAAQAAKFEAGETQAPPAPPAGSAGSARSEADKKPADPAPGGAARIRRVQGA